MLLKQSVRHGHEEHPRAGICSFLLQHHIPGLLSLWSLLSIPGAGAGALCPTSLRVVGEISRQNLASAEPWGMLLCQGSLLGKGIRKDQVALPGSAAGSKLRFCCKLCPGRVWHCPCSPTPPGEAFVPQEAPSSSVASNGAEHFGHVFSSLLPHLALKPHHLLSNQPFHFSFLPPPTPPPPSHHLHLPQPASDCWREPARSHCAIFGS